MITLEFTGTCSLLTGSTLGTGLCVIKGVVGQLPGLWGPLGLDGTAPRVAESDQRPLSP